MTIAILKTAYEILDNGRRWKKHDPDTSLQKSRSAGMSTVSEDFTRMADLLENVGWTQRAYARDINGRHIDWTSEEAVCFCVWGAIKKVSAGPHTIRVLNEHVKQLGFETMAYWNDSVGKKKVVESLRMLAERHK